MGDTTAAAPRIVEGELTVSTRTQDLERTLRIRRGGTVSYVSLSGEGVPLETAVFVRWFITRLEK